MLLTYCEKLCLFLTSLLLVPASVQLKEAKLEAAEAERTRAQELELKRVEFLKSRQALLQLFGTTVRMTAISRQSLKLQIDV